MLQKEILHNYLEAILAGERQQARKVVEKTLQQGIPANSVYMDLIWPIMVEIDNLQRNDKITNIQSNLATRINRTIVDQLQNKLPKKVAAEKKIAICCAPEEIHELGAQITADLFESNGWEVKFIGGGLTNDDILSFVNDFGPDILLIYGSAGKQAPAIRELITKVKSVNAWPDMKVMVSGGVFNRADGLWQEIGADLFAPTAGEAVEVAISGNKPEYVDSEPERKKRRPRRKKNADADCDKD